MTKDSYIFFRREFIKNDFDLTSTFLCLNKNQLIDSACERELHVESVE